MLCVLPPAKILPGTSSMRVLAGIKFQKSCNEFSQEAHGPALLFCVKSCCYTAAALSRAAQQWQCAAFLHSAPHPGGPSSPQRMPRHASPSGSSSWLVAPPHDTVHSSEGSLLVTNWMEHWSARPKTRPPQLQLTSRSRHQEKGVISIADAVPRDLGLDGRQTLRAAVLL